MSKGTINKIILVGKVCQNPELETNIDGSQFVKLTLTTVDSYQDIQGQNNEETECHNLILQTKLAVLAHQYIVKGSKIYVEGKARKMQWVDQETGIEMNTQVVFVMDMTLMNSPIKCKPKAVHQKTPKESAIPFGNDDFVDDSYLDEWKN